MFEQDISLFLFDTDPTSDLKFPKMYENLIVWFNLFLVDSIEIQKINLKVNEFQYKFIFRNKSNPRPFGIIGNFIYSMCSKI